MAKPDLIRIKVLGSGIGVQDYHAVSMMDTGFTSLCVRFLQVNQKKMLK